MIFYLINIVKNSTFPEKYKFFTFICTLSFPSIWNFHIFHSKSKSWKSYLISVARMEMLLIDGPQAWKSYLPSAALMKRCLFSGISWMSPRLRSHICLQLPGWKCCLFSGISWTGPRRESHICFSCTHKNNAYSLGLAERAPGLEVIFAFSCPDENVAYSLVLAGRLQARKSYLPSAARMKMLLILWY